MIAVLCVALILAPPQVTCSSTETCAYTERLRRGTNKRIVVVTGAGDRLQRYYSADRVLRMGVKAFLSGHYASAHNMWSKLLALDIARLSVDQDDLIATIPFRVSKSDARELFAELHRQYDAEGSQRPQGMPQIPGVLDSVFEAIQRGKYGRARDLLRVAKDESPLLHRTAYIGALINIVKGKQDAAARDFIRLVLLPPEYVSPDIVGFSEEQIVAVRWLDKISWHRSAHRA